MIVCDRCREPAAVELAAQSVKDTMVMREALALGLTTGGETALCIACMVIFRKWVAELQSPDTSPVEVSRFP